MLKICTLPPPEIVIEWLVPSRITVFESVIVLVRTMVPLVENVTVPPACKAAFNAPGSRLLTTVWAATTRGNAKVSTAVAHHKDMLLRLKAEEDGNASSAPSSGRPMGRVFIGSL